MSLRAVGVTHSDPTTFTLARARENSAAAFLLPGTDNVRAADTSIDSMLSPLVDPIGVDNGLSAAFQFPGPFGMPDGSIQQRWKRRFGGAQFNDDMGVVSPKFETKAPTRELSALADRAEWLSR